MINLDKKDSFSISVIRNVCMFLLVFGHILPFISKDLNSVLSFFTHPVRYTFFFVSGYLFSFADIKEPGKWFYNRWLRIGVPCYLYVLCDFLLCGIKNGFSVSHWDIPAYIFNFYGYIKISVPGIATTHLWFITFILICYLFTPLLKKIRKEARIYVIFLLIIVQAVLCMTFPSYMNTYFIGYAVFAFAFFYGGKILDKKNLGKRSLFMVCLSALMIVLRLLCIFCMKESGFWDRFYNGIFVAYFDSIIGIAYMFLGFMWVSSCYEKLIKYKKGVDYADRLSYCIYLTHYFFCIGTFSVFALSIPMWVKIISVAVLSYFSSLSVNYVSQLIIARFRKK